MDIAFRRATLDDADVFGRIGALSWQASYEGIVPGEYLATVTPELRAEKFRLAYRALPQVAYWVVLADGVPAGIVNAHRSRDDDAQDCGEIGVIYFLPEYWRQGLGAAAMAHALQALRDQGFTQAVLWTFEQNTRARRFYEKQGFVLDGATKTLQIGRDLVEVRYRRTL